MDLVNPRIDEYAEQSTTRWPPDIAETLAFIDADKTGYPAYLDALLPKLSEHGLIVADNMLRDGAVLEADPDESTRAILDYNARAASDPALVSVLLTVRDGLTLVRKRSH